jgi:hypothetical protein
MGVDHNKLKELFSKNSFRVITVYIPEKDKWIDNRIRRD